LKETRIPTGASGGGFPAGCRKNARNFPIVHAAANETLETHGAAVLLARAGGPDELPRNRPKKTHLAYNQYMRKRQIIKTAPVDGVTRLAVILRKTNETGRIVAWLQAGALSERPAGALGFALTTMRPDG
jgi:hypothetical protein